MKRHSVQIPTQTDSLFGWLHMPQSQSDCVVVICPPFGYEYTHSHRSLRHLSDHLAHNGIPALRFDYSGTGDSPGNELDPDRLNQWATDIKNAIAYAKDATGAKKVCLLGIRFGASLAGLVASNDAIDFLVLWNPVVNGKRYVRELKAVARTSGGPHVPSSAIESGYLESAGFPVAKETLEGLTLFNLADLLGSVTSAETKILVIDRDDMESHQDLYQKLAAKGMNVSHKVMPGYAEMMAEPQFTKVPLLTLSLVSGWLKSFIGDEISQSKSAPIHLTPQRKISLTTESEGIEESTTYGTLKNLFGILSFKKNHKTDRPVVVFINSGTDHHVGANRLYVLLSRTLAEQGLDTFRMDLRGVGDSAGLNSNVAMTENHPYPSTVIEDVEQTLAFLRDQYGYKRFILAGLCSGAYTSFKSALNIKNFKIDEAILINPLVFHWVDGMSLDTPKHFQNVVYYRQAAKNFSNWFKLFLGRVQFRHIFCVAIQHLVRCIKDKFTSTKRTQLTHEIDEIFKQGRILSLWIARGDPGYDLLKAGAKEITKRELKSGKLRLSFIEGGDHTFTLLKPRLELVKNLTAYLGSRYVEQPPIEATNTTVSHWPLTMMGGISSVLNLFVPLFLVRVLDVDHVGRYKVFFLYLSVMPWFLLTAGVSNGLSHWAGHDQSHRQKLFRASWSLLLGIVGGALAIGAISFALVALLSKNPTVVFGSWSSLEVAIFAWAAAVTILSPFFEDASVALGKVWRGAFFNGGFEFLRNITILTSTLVFRSVLAVFVSHAAILTLKFLLGTVLGWREGFQKPAWNLNDLKRVAKYAVPVSISAVFGILTNYVDQFVLARWVEPAAFAIYSIGCITIPPLLIFEQAVNKVLIPKMTTAFQNQENDKAALLYRGAMSEIAWLMVPAAFGLFVFAEPIILMLFTEKFRGSIQYLQGYAFGFLAYAVPFDAVARARGNGQWILRMQMTFSTLALMLSLLFTHLYGAMGTLASVILMKVIMPSITLRLVFKEQGWSISKTVPWKDWGTYIGISVFFMALSYAAKASFSSTLTWLLVCGVGSFAFYVALTAPKNVREGFLRRATQILGRKK